jgi:hypothetical protein
VYPALAAQLARDGSCAAMDSRGEGGMVSM